MCGCIVKKSDIRQVEIISRVFYPKVSEFSNSNWLRSTLNRGIATVAKCYGG